MASKKQQSEYALVWWLKEKLTGIVPLKARESRKINEIVNLGWEDKVHKTKFVEKAKILALGDYNELNKIHVDSEGKICDKGVKILSSIEIEEEKKIESSENKEEKITIKHEAIMHFEQELEPENPLCSIPSSSSSKNNVQFHPPLTSSSKSNRNIQNNTVGEGTDLLSAESSTSDEDELLHDEEKNTPEKSDVCELTQLLFPNGVTKKDIENQRNYLKVMEKVYEQQMKQNNCSEEINHVAEEYIKPGTSRVEIVPGSGVYLLESRKSLIEARSNLVRDEPWKQLVRLALFEIYGNTIQNYCAAGKRSSKPQINPQILDGIYQWANSRMPDNKVIEWKFFIKLVNTISNNKKRQSRKAQQSSSDENEEKKATKRHKNGTNISRDVVENTSMSKFRKSSIKKEPTNKNKCT